MRLCGCISIIFGILIYYGNSQYSGSGTVYVGSKALNSDNGLNVEITIRTGFDTSDGTTNGVEVSLTNNLNTFTYWTGVGFGSSVMVGTFAIICADSFMERQLGNQAPGSSLTGIINILLIYYRYYCPNIEI